MTLHRAPRRRSGLGSAGDVEDRSAPGGPAAAGSGRGQLFDTSISVLAKTWWVVTTAAVVVGTAVHFDVVTESNLGPLARTAEVAASPDGFGAVDSDFYAYPNASYAGMDLAVLDARVVPRFQTGSPIAVVELGVRNQTNQQARLPMKMVRLVGPNGTKVDLDRFEYTDFSTRMVIERGQTALGLAVFLLPVGASTDTSEYHLEIAENGRWPVSVPLSGDVTLPADAYPQPLEVASVAGQLEARGLDIELTEATSALEYGVYRASVGNHLAVVTVEITGSQPDATAALDRELWTLVESKLGGNRNVISQKEKRAIRVLSSEPTVAQTASVAGSDGVTAAEVTVTLQLVFSYSTESSKLALRFGLPGSSQGVADFTVQPGA